MTYKPFKMKGHTLPGINQKEGHPKVAVEGLAASSPLQDYKKGYYGEGKSPNKWAQFIPMAISAVSSMMKKNKDED